MADEAQRAAEPRHLLLTHGTFSDRRVCMTMARAWAEQGHVAWILEWRGHGRSDRVAEPYDMETVAERDVPAALHELQRLAPLAPLCVATHSGGGLALTMALLRQPGLASRLHKVALFACQACDAAGTPWRVARLAAAAAITRVYGRIPARPLRLGVQDESHAMMGPWFRWNLTRSFRGRDGFDYGARQRDIVVPVMAIAAQADHFIAPAGACHRFWSRFGAPAQGQFLVCGPSTGYAQAYGHATIMHSPQAAQEVLPGVIAWLLQ
ncbi:alpha/beta fold hydrolase [Ottowia sp.]|uniref:alpha/beta fold hydrolase n=1 Tax=Ottowia sp. TaxID=1898956 RepID=UPI002C9F8729|nr:alpha/beta fold hydrolase [Ottowia sp.]HOB66199.1 alpha/beta fold hydrolase [Ottowia sp.]HPZ58242.1 alpha/beta fold hydrolase [Ottowia sp.]HQD48594.1 alpha/beta fold hydrolase [Ottowia sp.]